MRFVLFLVFLISVLFAINAYVLRRAANSFSLSPTARRGLVLFLFAPPVGMLVGRAADRVWASSGAGILLGVSSTVELAILIAAVVLGIFDLTAWLPRVVGSIQRVGSRTRISNSVSTSAPARHEAPAGPSTSETRPPKKQREPAESPEISRRALLSRATVGSAFLIGGSSSLYGALRGRVDYAIEEHPVRIPGLSRALDGFTIVQLSDIHIGQFVGDSELAVAEALVEKARPDLIVLTGDLLDHDPRVAHRLGGFVRRLVPRAREGVVAISGNHDFFAGIGATVAALSAGGARVLRNRGAVVGDGKAGFALLGVDDVWAARMGAGGGPDLGRSIESLPSLGGRVAPARDLPRILLCHNPVFFEQAAGEVALQLSGHTHGGQINLLVRPADWVLGHGWVAGAYHRNGSQLYVNRGFGTVGAPARIGARPEVTRVVLHS